jgi:ABC-type bacteriocin/lantibiotic exporter with double-glycine peptidase domain/DNA-binding CsgD family transcriptional regulator
MPHRIPYIAQLEMADCSAACLAMTIAYHGKHVGLDEVRDAVGVGRGGADARGIVEAARAYGLSARGVKADVHELGHLPRGSILHWQFRHFVVLDRVGRRGIHVVDPVAGRAYIRRELFGRSYTGVAIALEPGPDWETGGRRVNGALRYLRPMLRETRLVWPILVTSILLRVFALALPLFTAALVNRILPGDERQLLYVLAAGMLAIAAYHWFTAFLRSRLLLTLRTKLDMKLTLGFVEHLVDLPYAFFLKRSGGDLAMRLQSNAAVRELLTTGALSAVLDGTFACFYIVILLILSPSMGLLVLGLGVLQVAVLVLARRRNERLMAESLHVQARSQSYVYQLLAGIEDLKAAGAERRASAHWSNLFVDQINVSLARGRLDALTESTTAGLSVASPLAVLAVGGALVLNGSLSTGDMLALAALSAGFLVPLSGLVTTGLQLQLLGGYMQRINDVLDAPKEQQDRPVRRAPTLNGRIAAESVSFRYSRLAPLVVEDVSLEVESGRTLAIVGRSGSGKTTLGRLLLGLYRPEAGRILYDGIDLAELEARSVRSQLGIVTQRPYLFGTSIRENIALTDPSLDLDAVVGAARLACIDEDITAMRRGYETLMIDGGASLSGGQRQRVALARALAHAPSILLLDEATSELDALTERVVYNNIAGLGCTAIVIAHRLSTIAGADLILVMEGGRIVERGTHEELLSLHGRYHELIASQREGGPHAHLRPADLDGLTKREHQILRLVANGLSNREIADSLVISPLTAKTHVSHILKKLDCHDRAELMTLAHERGAVTRSMGRVEPHPSNEAGKRFTFGSNGNNDDFPATKGRGISGEWVGDVHVVRGDNGWRVDVEGQGRASGMHDTQQAAWQQAKQIAQRNQSEALLHGRNGQIRERKTYRHDPRRTQPDV